MWKVKQILIQSVIQMLMQTFTSLEGRTDFYVESHTNFNAEAQTIFFLSSTDFKRCYHSWNCVQLKHSSLSAYCNIRNDFITIFPNVALQDPLLLSFWKKNFFHASGSIITSEFLYIVFSFYVVYVTSHRKLYVLKFGENSQSLHPPTYIYIYI